MKKHLLFLTLLSCVCINQSIGLADTVVDESNQQINSSLVVVTADREGLEQPVSPPHVQVTSSVQASNHLLEQTLSHSVPTEAADQEENHEQKTSSENAGLNDNSSEEAIFVVSEFVEELYDDKLITEENLTPLEEPVSLTSRTDLSDDGTEKIRHSSETDKAEVVVSSEFVSELYDSKVIKEVDLTPSEEKEEGTPQAEPDKLDQQEVDAILAQAPTNLSELETYFYAKLASDVRLKEYFYKNLTTDSLIKLYFAAVDGIELPEDYLNRTDSENRQLKTHFYMTLQKDKSFREYFYRSAEEPEALEERFEEEGTAFFKRGGSKSNKSSSKNPKRAPKQGLVARIINAIVPKRTTTPPRPQAPKKSSQPTKATPTKLNNSFHQAKQQVTKAQKQLEQHTKANHKIIHANNTYHGTGYFHTQHTVQEKKIIAQNNQLKQQVAKAQQGVANEVAKYHYTNVYKSILETGRRPDGSLATPLEKKIAPHIPKLDATLQVAQTASVVASAVGYQNVSKPVVKNVFTPKKKSIQQKNPLDGTIYTNKVQRQMKQGDFHSFPNHVDAFGADGKVSQIVGNDGIVRTKLEISGSYKGRDGNFEYIIEPNKTINHRFFKPSK